MYVMLNPFCWSIRRTWLDGVQTQSRSSAWWMRCTLLFWDGLYLVSSDGGRAMAASTVLPSMSGNSIMIVSKTIPEYDPALCPRINMGPTMYPVNLRYSAGRISGGRQTPTNGCATSSLVNRRRLCVYPGHGGFLCAGEIGQKCSNFAARLIICACT